MKFIVPFGRLCFAAIFIAASFGHFSAESIGYAASQGVPMPGMLVPLSGLMSLVGGLSVLLGYKARYGACLLVLFLIPVTLMMHKFWGVTDPKVAIIQLSMFMKNLSMFGAALLITYFGAGPLSIDHNQK